MQPKSFFWTLSHSAFSIAASMSLLAHLEPQRHLLLFGVVFGTAIHLMSWPLFGWIRECQPRVSIGKAWSTALVLWLAGFALTYAIPVPMPHGESAGKQVDVQVSALGPSASGDSKAAEVWFAIEANGSRVPLDEIQHAGNWQAKDGMLYATQAGGSAARWSGKATSLQVVLLSHPWSGRAVVRWNGESREIDLHKETPGNATTSISLLGDAHPNLWMTFPDRTALQRAVQLLDAMLIAFVLYVLQLRLVGVARTPVDEHGSMLVQSIRYALPSWTVSACLLLVFWPGLMSNDSVAQWRDAATGVSSDWHPVYHTLFIALARAIWDSPSFIAMLQAGALGLSTGWLIAVIEKVARTPKSVSHLASWCCGLMPIIAFSSISLWKDVPYAASVVAITAGSLSVLLLGKPRLSHPLPFAATLAILLVCILFRHNGPPLAATALAMVFLLSKANRRPTEGTSQRCARSEAFECCVWPLRAPHRSPSRGR
jgi:hypothetical protein